MQLDSNGSMFVSPVVELFTTSTASSIKTKKDCNRLRALLVAKKIPFIEVDLAEQVLRRRGMLERSNNVDTLPQLHANGRFIGDLAQVQELEDFGELWDTIFESAAGGKMWQFQQGQTTGVPGSSLNIASTYDTQKEAAMPAVAASEGSSEREVIGSRQAQGASAAGCSRTPVEGPVCRDSPSALDSIFSAARGPSTDSPAASADTRDSHSPTQEGCSPASGPSLEPQPEQETSSSKSGSTCGGLYRAADRVQDATAETESRSAASKSSSGTASPALSNQDLPLGDAKIQSHRAWQLCRGDIESQQGAVACDLEGQLSSDSVERSLYAELAMLRDGRLAQLRKDQSFQSTTAGSCSQSNSDDTADLAVELDKLRLQQREQADSLAEGVLTTSDMQRPREEEAFLDWAFSADHDTDTD